MLDLSKFKAFGDNLKVTQIIGFAFKSAENIVGRGDNVFHHSFKKQNQNFESH